MTKGDIIKWIKIDFEELKCDFPWTPETDLLQQIAEVSLDGYDNETYDEVMTELGLETV